MLLPLVSCAVAGLLGAACADDRAVAVIAHRGASWDAPEHTFAAWDLALAHGADWLEFDLQQTADSVLVVLHDDSLDRTGRGAPGDCRGAVRERTWAQLQRCDVGRWFNERNPARARAAFDGQRIATLDDVLQRYAGRARLYIELKSPEDAPGMVERFVGALQARDLAGPSAPGGRILVQSFSPDALERVHALSPDLPLVQLVWDSIPSAQLDAALARVAAYARGIGPSSRITDQRLVDAAHAKGLLVHVYTVNEEPRMRALLEMGVDGLFTDRPDLLRRVLGAR